MGWMEEWRWNGMEWMEWMDGMEWMEWTWNGMEWKAHVKANGDE